MALFFQERYGMVLVLRTKLQHDIADLLWSADSMDSVNSIVSQFGPDAVMIRDMMLADELDKITEVEDETIDVIRNIMWRE